MLAESHKSARKIISLHLCLCLKWKYVAYNSLQPFYSAVCLGGLWCRAFLALKQVKSMAQYAGLMLMSQESEQTAFSTNETFFKSFQKIWFLFLWQRAYRGSATGGCLYLLTEFGLSCPTSSLPMLLALHSHMVQLTLSGLMTCIPLTNVFWGEIKTF